MTPRRSSAPAPVLSCLSLSLSLSPQAGTSQPFYLRAAPAQPSIVRPYRITAITAVAANRYLNGIDGGGDNDAQDNGSGVSSKRKASWGRGLRSIDDRSNERMKGLLLLCAFLTRSG